MPGVKMDVATGTVLQVATSEQEGLRIMLRIERLTSWISPEIEDNIEMIGACFPAFEILSIM
jgi:hypothetical protein